MWDIYILKYYSLPNYYFIDISTIVYPTFTNNIITLVPLILKLYSVYKDS